ncbi:hypothetical protein EV667_1970 [Ancylobacter aquaticus]|uniref:Uncharacterized protein n=1 Tax=Ancylobacter aquaticus TaxID=100 RepID=A0A4R1HYR3_ANCAQ|nr:hypothetical protein [Ancylobacter aquaticus]TCK27974.1 hypothetical protein EV667_1970 [Ancylobacter aquaticus]
MNLHTPINDNAIPAQRQPSVAPRSILELEADYWCARAEWLPLNAHWKPLHDVAMKAAEAAIKALGGTSRVQTGDQQWAIASAIYDANGATAAGRAESQVEVRMDNALGQLVDTPACSLLELAAKARLALLDLHGIEDAGAVDCEEADWPEHVMTKLVLDIERLAGRQA